VLVQRCCKGETNHASGPEGALGRLETGGICGTDYERYDGEYHPHYPTIPGHEPFRRGASMESNPNERRKHLRVPTRILIQYRSADQFFTDYIQNLSRGGIFVPTHDPLPEGTRLEIAFALPGCDRLVTTQGTVVHSIRNANNGNIETSGMGFQFGALNEADQQLIDAYVSSLV
jgi:uncharacterized protein (TIGR02266 family)